MQIKIESNFADIQRQFSHMRKQVTFAGAVALTKTAVDARSELVRALPSIIDRPVPYTLNSMYVKKASPSRMESEVGFKDNYSSGSAAESKHYLMALINGGPRRTKRFEGRLIMTGKLSRGEHLVPTKFADIDAFGNVSRGQITKILSQLKTAVVLGDNSNASDSKRSRAKRAVEEYFWSGGPGTTRTYVRVSRDKNGRVTSRRLVTAREHLRKGVWMVRRTAFGNSVKPIFFAVPRTRYRRQFDLAGIVDRVHKARFAPNFEAAFSNAIKTAR